MTQHYSSKWANLPETTDDLAPVTAPAAPKNKRKRKIAIAAVAALAVGVPATAWAAVNFFGFGSFEQGPAAAGTIAITNGALANTLAPGQTVGVKGNVKNTNDYPITVKSLYIKKSSMALLPAGAAQADCKITPMPGADVAFPKPDGTDEGPNTGIKYNLATPVVIQPGFTTTVTVPNVIKQDASATKMCGVKADYAVEFAAGS